MTAVDSSPGILLAPSTAHIPRRSRRNLRPATKHGGEQVFDAYASDHAPVGQAMSTSFQSTLALAGVSSARIKNCPTALPADTSVSAPPAAKPSRKAKTAARTKKPRTNLPRPTVHPPSIDSAPGGQSEGVTLEPGPAADSEQQPLLAKPGRKRKAPRKATGGIAKRRKRNAAGDPSTSGSIAPDAPSVPSTTGSRSSRIQPVPALPVTSLPFPLIGGERENHSRLTSVVAALAARTGTGSLPRTPVQRPDPDPHLA